MPDDVVERPNPPPLPSQIPDAVLELRVKLPTERRDVLSPEDRQGLVQYRRLACYIAACELLGHHIQQLPSGPNS